MKIEKLNVGPLGACCYIVINEDTKQAIIIDPGGSHQDIIDLIEKNGLAPRLIINTHGHGDHMGANKEVKETFPEIKIAIHKDDVECLTQPKKNLSFLGGFLLKSPPADIVLKEGDKVGIDGIELEVIHTPGHTPGGICLLGRSSSDSDSDSDKNPDVLFSGDTLFQEGVGRTDLPGGDHAALIKSIQEKIFTLAGDVTVYPGHGDTTTIEEEKNSNPFVQSA
ncbi:MAG: MBL fold metallo-hydrolase [Candidatus Brocadiales bacterium]|nr:MBL fold metallo-hydrolase [Candidatus Bathyanammoxibius sp.]